MSKSNNQDSEFKDRHIEILRAALGFHNPENFDASLETIKKNFYYPDPHQTIT